MGKTVLVLLFPLLVFAHRVDLFVEGEEGTLQIWAYYPDGTPAKGADIEILSPEGKLLYKGKTDKEGQLRWSVPKGVKEVKVILYAGLGHRAETSYRIEKLNSSGNGIGNKTYSNTGKIESEENLNGKPLSKPVEEGMSWGKIFCGLGWIFGIFGILNLLYGFRKRKQS